MAKISNSEIMDRFKRIEELSDKSQVKKIHDQIINDLSFLVYNNTKKYLRFSNYEDLNQEGFIGLIKATRNFNYKLFPNFFVFANQWIINGIRRSAKKYDIVYNPNRIKTVYINNEETFYSDEQLDQENLFYKKEKNKKIRKVVDSLESRNKIIINSLFGINSKAYTLRGAENICGLTYERIRQIKNETIEKLKLDKNLLDIEMGE